MKQITLWRIVHGDKGEPKAVPVDTLDTTKTEQELEDVLVATPELLMPGLSLIGRQVPTAGGPLDLLGVTRDGRLVIFELKRGMLTREAVAQVIDYASFLHELDYKQLCAWIERTSGTGGVLRVDDFAAWYREEFSSDPDVLKEPPAMVLVGLGVDDRARRMVEFLSSRGVDISLLTFHAFELDRQALLARQTQVESPPDRPPGRDDTKEARAAALRSLAESLGVAELFEKVTKDVRQVLPSLAYQWPGRSTYTFSLPERTDKGTLSQHVYVWVMLSRSRIGEVGVGFLPRAVEASGEAFTAFRDLIGDRLQLETSWGGQSVWSLWFKSAEEWEHTRNQVRCVLEAMVQGWQTAASENEETPGIVEEGTL